MSTALTFDDASLAALLQDHAGLLVVDVWAEWCAPCRALAQTIDALAERYVGQATVGKLVFDTSAVASESFGVRSIPTVLFFRDGALVDRIVGAYPMPVFVERVDALLAPLAAA